MIGSFGYLDAPAGALTVYLWLLPIGGLIVMALAASGRRQMAVLMALIAAVVVMPVIVQVPDAATRGFPWQGRYTLPLAAGIPILASLHIDQSKQLPAKLAQRLTLILLGTFAVGHLCAHVWVAHRYISGVDGPLNWLSGRGWQPPIPAWLLLIGFAGALGLTARWFARLATADHLATQ